MAQFSTSEASGTPGRSRLRWLLLGLGVVLIGGYLAVAAMVGSKVPSGTTMAGVDLGGMSQSDARAALREKAQQSNELTVKAGSKSLTLDAAKSGVSLNADASVGSLTGFSLNPLRVLAHLRGGGAQEPVVEVNESQFSSALKKATATIASVPVEPKVAFAGTEVSVVPGKAGTVVESGNVLDQVKNTWPSSTTMTAQTSSRSPALTQEAVDAFVKDKAQPVVAGPVTVTNGDKSFQMSPQAFIDGVSIVTKDKQLALAFDKKKLADSIQAAGTQAGMFVPAKNATVVSSGGKFSVVESVAGTTVDAASLAQPMEAAVQASGDQRIVRVTTTTVQPQVTTEQARATIPTEVISTFTTTMPVNPGRTANIARAAGTINGTYVAPGQTFSLNAALGQRTVAGGYNEAPVILNGRLTKQPGGGISQLSTTLFNAIFFSGAQIDEFHPHSFYISRYPKGREATISWPDVDNRFTNNTKGGILIKAFVSGQNVTVTFYGRKTWDVQAVTGPERNVTKPKKIVDNKATCVPQSPSNGFDITTTRIWRQNGAEVKRQSFNVHYIPEDEVDCTNPAAGN